MTNSKKYILNILRKFPLILITAVLTLLIAFLTVGGDITRIFEQIPLIKKVTTIDSKINKNAVNFSLDNEQVGDKLAESYIDMLENDDYAKYFGKADFIQKENEREGVSQKSIGVLIAVKDGEKYPTICFVHSKSPAKKAGIKKGDILIKINGQTLKNQSTEKAAELIKERNTAKIIVKRKSQMLYFSVKSDVFIYDSVTYKMVGSVCIIKITEFEEPTLTQFDEALKFLKKNNAKSVIFDLRNNPGGYVDVCAKMLDKVLPKGDTVRMKLKNGDIKTLYSSDDENKLDLPFAVIVNGKSASAAEIFTMNIKELGKGIIIGEKTYGKGIAQTTYDLDDGTAIKFTTETVVDKNGKTYHKKGIKPDFKVKFSYYQNKNYMFLSDNEDSQLQKALEILNKQL